MEATTNTRLENAKQWVEDHRRQLLSVLAIVAVIIVLIGLSLTWFVNSNNLSTITKIQTPADPKVLGPNETSIGTLEITYDEERGDKKDANGNVTIDRAFCVQSSNEKTNPDGGGQPFELQLANTTNIKDLKISVYRVSVNDPRSTAGDVVGLDGLNNPFSWSKTGNAIDFSLINPATQNDDSLAKNLATPDPTFENYTNVQKNARPLYRYKTFAKEKLDGYNAETEKASDATNFIIECTWNASDSANLKETDMLYLIAVPRKNTSN